LRSGLHRSVDHVNHQGGVQQTTPQVTLYKLHTAEESLRRFGAIEHLTMKITKKFTNISPGKKDMVE
jgi:hypothetical protein